MIKWIKDHDHLDHDRNRSWSDKKNSIMTWKLDHDLKTWSWSTPIMIHMDHDQVWCRSWSSFKKLIMIVIRSWSPTLSPCCPEILPRKKFFVRNTRKIFRKMFSEKFFVVLDEKIFRENVFEKIFTKIFACCFVNFFRKFFFANTFRNVFRLKLTTILFSE